MSTFILEIGTEELPSRFLAAEESFLASAFASALDENFLSHGAIRTFSTPRRAVVMVNDLALVQPMREEEVMGPPARVAYRDGVPTRALEGFCRTAGVSVGDARVVSTPKGEYVAATRRVGGRLAADILAEVCPGVVSRIPFAKRMRWNGHEFAYARPLQWILALLDEEVVPFRVGPVESGRVTYGHRIHGRGPFEVEKAEDFLGVLTARGRVVPDGEARRAIVRGEAVGAAAALGGRVLWDDALLEEVSGLVEHPVVVVGSFDEKFLEVPREVLVTSMQTHQKSFGVEAEDGSLLPHFVTVLNLRPESLDLVRHGWERVLRARLEDARFFWHEDLKASFDVWLEALERVIFIRGLGTMGDRSRRLESLCGWLASACAPGLETAARRAGRLAKADLVSAMVGEFDTLQGVMGGIYAARWNEDPDVAAALREQYLPAGPDSPLPSTLCGALLSVADKADTLAGCFGLDLVPTGAADPNGLRRCALGIIRVLSRFGLRLDARELFARAQAGYGEREWKAAPAESLERLMGFFRGRLRGHLQHLGANTLLVDAAIGSGCPDVKGVEDRLAALEAFSKGEGYTRSVQTFKRAANILARQRAAGAAVPEAWDPALLKEEPERALAAALGEALPRIDALRASGDHLSALGVLDELRPAVDAFFDGVMVACEDPALRANRLALLASMAGRFSKIADFAALQI